MRNSSINRMTTDISILIWFKTYHPASKNDLSNHYKSPKLVWCAWQKEEIIAKYIFCLEIHKGYFQTIKYAQRLFCMREQTKKNRQKIDLSMSLAVQFVLNNIGKVTIGLNIVWFRVRMLVIGSLFAQFLVEVWVSSLQDIFQILW